MIRRHAARRTCAGIEGSTKISFFSSPCEAEKSLCGPTVPVGHVIESGSAPAYSQSKGLNGLDRCMTNRAGNGCSVIFLIIVLLSSCSSEQDQRRKTLQGILSWTASAEMIVDARTVGQVPETYSGLAITRCREEVTTLVNELGDGAPHAVKNIQPLLQSAADTASKGDRSAAERILEALRHARSEIESGMPEA
ncbi:hypothetical protein GOZ89_22790 [Agrobacterium vitis]|uniref:hypothetical protein n=1 Tax=Agrobacterium vitis TaxID=373 RepID=UPI0012E6F385|nr:hypothetical protein [Agrobacterium vitis]MVA82241.1 hypothetical protein [Agrobacterium vitis]